MVSLNRNIYGRNQDQVYEVSLSNAVFMTDGTIETYTFPIQTFDSITKYNLMLNLENGEYKPYLIYYDLSDAEYAAYLQGEFIDFSTKASGYKLENDDITITERLGPAGSTCTQINLMYVQLCDHPHHQEAHIMQGGQCEHPTEVWETVMVSCPGGGGGGEGDGTSGIPPGPGSPGGTYGGPTNGNPTGGFTGLVIAEGGTANQDDVNAINQVTQEMDAAFGVGNWSFNDNPSDNVPEYSSVQEFINDNLGLTSNHSDFQIELDQISNINRIVRGKLRLMRYTNSGLKFTLQIENINEINMDINENLSSIINYGPESNYFSFYPDNSNNIFEGPYAFYEQSLRYNVYGVVKREWKIANNITLPLVINIPIHIQIIISNVTGEVISTSWDYNW